MTLYFHCSCCYITRLENETKSGWATSHAESDKNIFALSSQPSQSCEAIDPKKAAREVLKSVATKPASLSDLKQNQLLERWQRADVIQAPRARLFVLTISIDLECS